MKKGIVATIGIGIVLVIVAAAYGLNSMDDIETPNESEESVSFSDNVTPVLETAEPEGKLLEVSVSDAITAEESP